MTVAELTEKLKDLAFPAVLVAVGLAALVALGAGAEWRDRCEAHGGYPIRGDCLRGVTVIDVDQR